MKQVSGKDFIKVIKKHGWCLDRIKGSHHHFIKQGVKTILTVPVHGNRPLRPGTLRKLINRAGLPYTF